VKLSAKQIIHTSFTFLFFLLLCLDGFGQPPPSVLPSNSNIQAGDDTAKVQIIYSEKLIGTVSGNQRVKTLVGNVQLRQNDVDMRCDSAVVIGNDVEAFGNVIIIQADTVKIFADSVFYFGDARTAKLIGEVVLTDSKATLFTEQLDYNLNTKIASYNSGAILENQGSKLTSDRGYYHTRTSLAYFGGNVKVADPEYSLTADTLMVNTDENISYFIGPTNILTKDGDQIYTEKGFFDSKNEYAEFQQRPRFKNEDGFAKAKLIRYDGKADKIYLEGDAYFKNENQEAEAETIIYDTKQKQFSSVGGTTIKEEGRTIVSETSFYDDSLEVAVFVGNACISDSNQIICADSIRYNENTKQGRAFGNVVSRDTVENITLECEQLDYNDSTNYVIAIGRPLMTTLINDDTLFLAADTLYSFTRDSTGADSTRVLIAHKNVRVYKTDFQAICDSLVYESADSIFQFFINPVLWSDTSQFTADTIRAYLKNETIDHIKLKQNSFLINSTDEIYYNQIKGRDITALFKNDSIRTMLVDGSGETVYYIQDEQKAYITANKTTCSRMTITFNKNEVKDILFYTQPQGQTHPIKNLNPKKLEMSGFSWRIKERPKSKDDLR